MSGEKATGKTSDCSAQELLNSRPAEVSKDAKSAARKAVVSFVVDEDHNEPGRELGIQHAREKLHEEKEARETAQRALQEKSNELEIHAIRLEEAHTALKVLLKEREEERHTIEERIVCNINELVRPLLARLAATRLNAHQRELLDAIVGGLNEIAAPLSRRLVIETSRLSPTQIKVAGLIRQGYATKEIAELLGVAISTIDFHRLNIRRKLNLNDRQINLQSYLQSLV